MRGLSATIIQPTIIGMGASIFLYSYNRDLQIEDYFLHLPFWISVVRPSGIYWQSQFLKQINKGIFPPQMKIYRQMYLVSKNAILYDFVLNHTLYHSFLTPLLIVYMYAAKTLLGKTKFNRISFYGISHDIDQGKSSHFMCKYFFRILGYTFFLEASRINFDFLFANECQKVFNGKVNAVKLVMVGSHSERVFQKLSQKRSGVKTGQNPTSMTHLLNLKMKNPKKQQFGIQFDFIS